MALIDIEEVSLAEMPDQQLWGRHIDLPKAGSQAELSAVNIVGWVLGHKVPAVAVEILHGEVVIRRVPLGVHRPDLAMAFPQVPGAGQSGFRTTVSLLGTTAALELWLQAVLQDQRRVPIGKLRLQQRWQENRDEDGMPLVSVIIPCYNQAHFLSEAIESVLKQTYPYIEVVVVDDGSTDNTAEVAARYPGVRCIQQANQGRAEVRNTGLRQSDGDYIVFLDADDRLLPHALETGVAELQVHPECAFVSGQHRLITIDGSVLAELPLSHVVDNHYLALLHRNYIAMNATVMYRRQIFESVIGFNTSLKACEDYELYLRIAQRFPIYCHDTVVAEYRRHNTNITCDSGLMLKTALSVLRSQWKYINQSRERTEAYQRGVRFWQEYYGKPLLEEVREYLRGYRWQQALQGSLVLLRYYPKGFAFILPGYWRSLTNRVWQQATSRGKQNREKSQNPMWSVLSDNVYQVSSKAVETTTHADRTANTVPLPPRVAVASASQGALILLYHRVAELSSDPWLLSVKPNHFAEHLAILRQRYQPVRLQDLVYLLNDGNLPNRGVVLTFDDGYVDNLHNVKSALERYDVPATAFLTGGHLRHEREFWWDELERLLLQPSVLPEVLQLHVNGRSYQWELGEAVNYTEDFYRQHQSWRVWEEAPSARHALYYSLWQLLHPLLEEERQKILNELLSWAETELVTRPTHRSLSLEEIFSLAQGSLVEIGAHTVTHSTLSALPLPLQREEIQQSKVCLEEVLGKPVNSFAYPYGRRSDYTAETITVVREAGFMCACSNFAERVSRSTDCFQLPRIQVQDWDGEEFARQLSRWFDG